MQRMIKTAAYIRAYKVQDTFKSIANLIDNILCVDFSRNFFLDSSFAILRTVVLIM